MPEIIRATFALYGTHPGLFLVLALAVVAPYELIVLAVTGVPPLGQQRASAATAFTLLLLDFALIGPLVSALYVHAVGALARGSRLPLQDVIMRGLRVFPVVVAAQIVAGLGIGIGLLLFVIPGVILSIRWAVVAQAAAIERTDWMGALRRSGELVRGHYAHVLLVLLFTGVLNALLISLAESAAGSRAGVGQVTLGIVVVTLTRSITALTTAVLYFDLLSRESAQAPAPPPGYD